MKIQVITQQEAKQYLSELDSAVNAIFTKQYSNLTFDEHYRKVYNLVRFRYGEQVYSNLEQLFQKNIQMSFLKLHKQLDLQDDFILNEIDKIWKETKLFIDVVKNIYLYMDRNYSYQKKLKPVQIMGYQIFRELLLSHEYDVHTRLITQILKKIEQERNGYQIDYLIIKSLLQMMIDIGQQMTPIPQNSSQFLSQQGFFKLKESKEYYIRNFEEAFIQDSIKYYMIEVQGLLESCSLTEYIQKVDQRFKEEKDRVLRYLDQSTEQKIIEAMTKILITDTTKIILEFERGGIYHLLQENQVVTLKAMLELFYRSQEAFVQLRNFYEQYIIQMCQKLKNDEILRKQPDNFIEKIINFRQQIYNIFNFTNLKDNHLTLKLMNSMVNAFENVFSKDQVFCWLLNSYFDYQFRKGFKTKTESEINNILDKALEIFQYFVDKDLFDEIFRKLLAQRLLENKSLNMDLEYLLLQKFKNQCGGQYVTKINNMFKDIQISKDLCVKYQFKNTNRSIKYEFYVNVLTAGSWPIEEMQQQLTINNELKLSIVNFTEFYQKNFKERYLTWCYQVGFANVVGYFPYKKKREFLVSSPQMYIMLLFNEAKILKIEQILQKLNMKLDDLKKNLIPMIQLNIFSCQSINSNEQANSLNMQDQISFNENFEHKMLRIIVPQIKEKKSSQLLKKEEDKLLELIMNERKYVIEACIVRIMKSRKRIQHNLLLDEVLKLIKLHNFTTEVGTIKACIESLIEKEYMERTENVNEYIYVAQIINLWFCMFN